MSQPSFVRVRRARSARLRWSCVALCVVAACHARTRGGEASLPPGSSVEAISLLGDSLRRPTPDSTVLARMEAQLADARRDALARPNDADALIWIGRRTAYLGRFREAVQIFSDGVRRFPNDARMYRHRGHRFITVRRFDDAIADFQRAANLTAGMPDEIEPDGQPNARNTPIGSLQSNIWYHLALAHYLKGDFESAARAARAGIQVSTNPDRLVSQTHWLYMALRRAGRNDEAAAALIPIRDDFDVIENGSYYRLLRMYKAGVSAAVMDSALSAGVRSAADASLAYGLANWFLYSGDTARAVRAYEQLMTGGQWPSFGYIAAEADLARLRRKQ